MKTKREKPGRKPIKDKVKGLTIYVKESKIKRAGGNKACREMLLSVADRW